MNYILSALVIVATLALVLLSFGALIETNAWWVRMTDFPRIHYLIGLILLLVFLAVARFMNGKLRLVLAVLALAAALYNERKLSPYFGLGDTAALACEEGDSFSLMVANVRKGNRSADALLRLVDQYSPDLFLAMETNEWWDEQLAALDSTMPHKAQRITGGFFGMHLFSQLPIQQTEVIFPVDQDAPAILTDVALRSGKSIRFIGLHPRPPHPGEASTGRDGQLMWAALQARDSKMPTVIGGDLNAVPWEVSIERLQRVGGFIDPRERHGYHATYDAKSWVMYWPLDQILHQAGLSVVSFTVLPSFGSDHYPVMATLCHTPSDMVPPQRHANDMAQAKQDIDLALQAAKAQP
jgi:endonuclease/exonuclease/phosphatase (EEP) superfamily protein YafD